MSITPAVANPAIPSSVLNAVNQATSSPSNPDSAASLQNNFMTLLVTQLKNQDPTNPVSNSELTSELAQINTLSGIQDLNTTLSTIGSQMTSSQYLQASGLIGSGVLVPGSTARVTAGGASIPIGVDLSAPASDVRVSITSASGKVINTVDLGAQPAGTQSFTWNGTDATGAAVPPGTYTVNVSATGQNGAVAATALQYATVTGVSGSASGPMLDLGGTHDQVALDSVRQIFPSSSNTNARDE
ncbi:MAG TPA: flagellar hook assembly protein FlgD [Nevskiaceae bacterium]|nr:flagellar hook assembly protein FlgD [Nevskiaceae bacterium]